MCDYCNESFAEVRACNIKKCPLWEYRMGHRPKNDSDPEQEGEEDAES